MASDSESSPLLGWSPSNGGTSSETIGNVPRRRARSRWIHSSVQSTHCSAPLTLLCVTTGLVGAACYRETDVWVGFQTGNLVQIGMAIPRWFDSAGGGGERGGDGGWSRRERDVRSLGDNLRILSLVSFFVGGFLAGRFGDLFRPRQRSWLVGSTLAQATLMSLAVALLQFAKVTQEAPSPKQESSFFALSPSIPKSPIDWSTPPAFLAFTFLSISSAIQAMMADRIGRPEFRNTVVMTANMLNLSAEPTLFQLRSKNRDLRFLGIAMVLLGALVGQLLGDRSFAVSVLVAVGIKVVVAFSWLGIPTESDEEPETK